MKYLTLILCCLAGYSSSRAQTYQNLILKHNPEAGKNLFLTYSPSIKDSVLNQLDQGICYAYTVSGKVTERKFELHKKQSPHTAELLIPDSAVLISLVFTNEGKTIKDNNQHKGYLLPVYKGNKPKPFAFAAIANLIGGGPPDAAGLKKSQPLALAAMKTEISNHPQNEKALMQTYYNMLANSPEREDKVILLKKLTALKSDQEPVLMMAQLYLSYFGSKQQADSLDKLLLTKFPDGAYVKLKKQQQEMEHQKAAEKHEVETVQKVNSKTPVDLTLLHQKLKESMLNEPVTSLSLKDRNGKEVTLGDETFAGKVIVIDFWATWCKPCIRSFPAMQNVMEKYKDNPSVKFFYINTMEQGDALANVQAFLEKNPLPFTMLMDEKTQDMNLYKAFTHYKVDGGIPYKLVIDGDGKIRFRVTGFNGNDAELIAELSGMIELALTK